MINDLQITDSFTTRQFFIQHLAAYEHVKLYAKDKVVLDAGMGDGYGANHLADIAKEVVGIDIEDSEVGKARKRFMRSNLKFSVGSLLNIDFPDSYFDIVISSQVVEHIELDMLSKYLSEIFRVLKNGGIFFVCTLNLFNNLKGRSLGKYDKNPEHIKEFMHEELKNLLLTRFKEAEILGLQKCPKHIFYTLLKKAAYLK